MLGGSLDEKQMLRSKMADFQLWDRALSDKEVTYLGCEEKGAWSLLMTLIQLDSESFNKAVTLSVTQLKVFSDLRFQGTHISIVQSCV